jgi:predicted transposase YdaD
VRRATTVKGLTHPHDSFFKALTDDPKAAAALLRERLPSALVDQLADEAPVLVDGSFVDDSLHTWLSDRLFRLKLQGKRELFVYALIEHKSSPEARAPLQVLGYMVRAWERLAKARERTGELPAIIPLVLYHGEVPWTGARRFANLVDAGGALLGVQPLDFELLVVDLGAIDDDSLSRDVTLRAGLLTLKYGCREAMQPSQLGAILSALRRAPSLLKPALRYMMETYKRIDRALLLGEAMRSMPEHKEQVMTIAQELREEGRKAGRVEGRVEGRQEALLRILARRFGQLPKKTRERVLAATPSELDTWLDRAVDAPTLDAVLSTH